MATVAVTKPALLASSKNAFKTSIPRHFRCARLATRSSISGAIAQRRPFHRSSVRRVEDNIHPETKAAIKKGGAGVIRWTWRLTKLAFFAGFGWLAYSVYTIRHPAEQLEPDPSKKTLVVLGMLRSQLPLSRPGLTRHRNRMGLRIPPEETGHRELQCHRHLSTQLLSFHTSSPLLHHRHHRASIDHGAHQKLPQA